VTAAAYKRYLEKFEAQETQIEQYQAKIKELLLGNLVAHGVGAAPCCQPSKGVGKYGRKDRPSVGRVHG
jgi:hypothetical protein